MREKVKTSPKNQIVLRMQISTIMMESSTEILQKAKDRIANMHF
jgi:hypothetical protein